MSFFVMGTPTWFRFILPIMCWPNFSFLCTLCHPMHWKKQLIVSFKNFIVLAKSWGWLGHLASYLQNSCKTVYINDNSNLCPSVMHLHCFKFASNSLKVKFFTSLQRAQRFQILDYASCDKTCCNKALPS